MERRPYKLKNKIQNYDWGTRGEDAYIPKLLGMTPEPGIPYAELWMGTHKNAPSNISLAQTEYSLSDYIDSDASSILGKKVAEKFNNKLPFLFKVLSIADPLSIQTHPNKEQAKFLYKAEPFKYPDDNHKPEIAIAIDKLEVLNGFKSVDAVRNICGEYFEIIKFIGEDNFNNIFEISDKSDSEKLKEFYLLLVGRANSDKDYYRQLLNSLRDIFLEKANRKVEKLFLRLYDKFDGDIGLITILFLNYIELNPGEAIFMSAGIPHAYLSGNVIECMANSDNVIRAGLTTKFVDIKTLLKVISYQSPNLDVIKPKTSKGRTVYITKAEEFKVIKIVSEENKKIKFGKEYQPSIFLLMDGTAKLKWKSGEIELISGESVFIPADTSSCYLEPNNASGYLATVNI